MRLVVFAAFSVTINVIGSEEICSDTPEILVPLKSRECCGSPVEATTEFLEGSTPITGACATFLASQRFERFREWITLKGGYVSEKISFQRGHFVDPVSGKAQIGYGGIFLNANEYLHHNELLFVIPEEATFSESMIMKQIPALKRFEIGGKDRTWLAVGLASLMQQDRDVVGPWQALLPDMRQDPLFWPKKDTDFFNRSQAMSSINVLRAEVMIVCDAGAQLLDQLELTCDDVMEAFAIIKSRGFEYQSLTRPGVMSVAIPFGADLLNHSPFAMFSKGRIFEGPEDDPRVSTYFFLTQLILSETRELFNNYGPQSLAGSFVAYGFSQPDPSDELFIVATSDAEFSGRRFTPIGLASHSCPARIGLLDLVTPVLSCKAAFQTKHDQVSEALGLFRMTDKDGIALSFDATEWRCRNLQNGFLWMFIESQLLKRNSVRPEISYRMNFNGPVGGEPELPVHVAVGYALCSMSPDSSVDEAKRFVHLASTCPATGSEMKLHSRIKALARQGLFDACAGHEFESLGGIEGSLKKWLAFRNLRVKQQNSNAIVQDVSNEIERYLQSSSREFIDFLGRIVDKKNVIYSDAGGLVDQTMRESKRMRPDRVFRLEEIFRYKMQSAYMVMMQCRKPLEAVLARKRS